MGSNPLVLVDPWGFSGHDPDNPPEPDPDAPPVVVTADRDESIILKILTFNPDNPDPMEVLETVGNFALGFGAAVAEDLSYGTQRTRYNGGMSYHVGKVVGHVFDMTLGAIGTIGGGTFATVTAPTGVGTVLGVSEAIYASSVMVSAGKNLSDELMNVNFDPETGGGGGNETSEQREATFPDERELARRLEINKKDIHEVKKVIIKQHEGLLKRSNVRNPDIGFDRSGKIVFKDRVSGRQIFTDTPLDSYKP